VQNIISSFSVKYLTQSWSRQRPLNLMHFPENRFLKTISAFPKTVAQRLLNLMHFPESRILKTVPAFPKTAAAAAAEFSPAFQGRVSASTIHPRRGSDA